MSVNPNVNPASNLPAFSDPDNANTELPFVIPPGLWQQLNPGGDGVQLNAMFGVPPMGPAGGNEGEMVYAPFGTLQRLFQPLIDQAAASHTELRELRSEYAEQKRQLGELGDRLKRTLPETPGDEGDDEGDGSAHINSSQSGPKSKRVCKGKAQLKPEGLHGMQDVYRRVITGGCGVEHYNELKLNGLDDDTLALVDDDWDEPWRPDFSKAWSSQRNKVWVDKINNAVMEDEEAQQLVSKGDFPALCFNAKFLS